MKSIPLWILLLFTAINALGQPALKIEKDIIRLKQLVASNNYACVELSDSLYNICQECDDSIRNEVYLARLNCACHFSEPDSVIAGLSEALYRAKKLNSYSQMAKACELLYIAFKKSDEPDIAEKYAIEAEQYAAHSKDTSQWLMLLNNLANVSASKSLDSAMNYFQRIEQIASSNEKFSDVLLTSQLNKATIYAMQDQLDSALNIYNQLINSKSYRTDYDVHMIYFNRGFCLFEMDDPDAAIADLKHSLVFLDSSFKKSELLTIETIAYVFLESAQFDSAAYYYQKAFDLQSDLFNVKTAEEVARLREELEAEQREFDITKLEAENRVERSQKQLLIGLSFALLLVLIVAFGMYRARLANQRLKAQQQIARLEKEKEVLSLQTMLFAQEEERQRIAQDLHDSIGALLSTAKLHINNIEDEFKQLSELNIIKTTKDIIDNATTEVRRVAHNMMPGVLMKLGLEEGLDEFFEKINDQTNIKVSFVYDELPKRLENKSEIMIYRMLQEMTNNTLKHSKATEIKVMMKISGEKLVITYKDDGVGFEASKMNDATSFGLAGLKSRAAFINATLELITSPRNGVQYVVSINL